MEIEGLRKLRDDKYLLSMPGQKFNRGDIVRVAEDLGPSMRHFPGAGKLAVVVGSYAQECRAHDRNGQNTKDYELDFGQGSSAWYHEHQLTLVEPA